MTRFFVKARFCEAYDSLNREEQRLALLALHEIKRFYATGEASYGLRIKKLCESREGQVFEARMSIALRILWAKREKEISFLMIGSHDEVSRFLKNLG